MSAATDRPVRILVVEDEFLIRLTLVEALTEEGYDVLEAESGDAALALLDANPDVALLLTDIQLPGSLDGRGLAAEARARRARFPVLFMTGRPDLAAEAAETAYDRYIAKPYMLTQICRMVRDLVAFEQAP